MKNGNRWSREDELTLLCFWCSGVSLLDISEFFDIEKDSIRRKISRLKAEDIPIPKRKPGLKMHQSTSLKAEAL